MLPKVALNDDRLVQVRELKTIDETVGAVPVLFSTAVTKKRPTPDAIAGKLVILLIAFRQELCTMFPHEMEPTMAHLGKNH